VPLDIESMRMRPPRQEAITALYSELEFASLLKKDVAGDGTVDIDFDPAPAEFKEPEALPDKEQDEIIDSIF
jgi:hypothetical protein